MALIYRSSPRNCLQGSSESTASRALQYLPHQIREIWYFLRAQKTLIPRVKLGSSNGQLENCPCRSKVGSGPGPGPGPAAGQLPQHLLTCAVFGCLSPRPCLGSASLLRASSLGPLAWRGGRLCYVSIFPGAGLPNRVRHFWGGHCWGGLPAEGPPVVELAQVPADPVVNRTVPMGLALFTDSIVLVSP